MTPDVLAEIEARLKAATPGPWKADNGCVSTTTGYAFMVADCGRAGPKEAAQPNAEFIAHTPEDIATLLRLVRQLREVVAYDVRLRRRHVAGMEDA